MAKKKFAVCVSSTMVTSLWAENKEQAEAMVEAMRSQEKKPEDYGISEEQAKALQLMNGYIIEVYEIA